MIDLLSYEFMRNAFGAGILAGIVSGFVGSFIYVKKMSFLAGGIAHSAFGAVGLALYFQLPVSIVLIPYVIIVSVIISLVSDSKMSGSDTAIALIWSLGMSIGLVLARAASDYAVDIAGFLFGNILLVDKLGIMTSIVIVSLVLLFIILFFHVLEAIAVDEEYAASLGIPVGLFKTGLLIACGLATAALLRLTGIILLMSMLLIPPAIANRFVKSIKGMILFSCILSALMAVFGIISSYYLDISVGPAIVFIASALFLLLKKDYNFFKINNLKKSS